MIEREAQLLLLLVVVLVTVTVLLVHTTSSDLLANRRASYVAGVVHDLQ